MKVITVVGARPQFIKAAPVSAALRSHAQFREVLVHTGQHYDDAMSEIFFRELEIPRPQYNLGVGSASHAVQTARMMEELDGIITIENPDLMLVYGDTNSTLAGALVAAKKQLPVAHVEAGLRSGNRGMPEEVNRILTDHVSDYLLAPTPGAVENLQHEGLSARSIHLVGDVMYDTALRSASKAPPRAPSLVALGVNSHYALVTIHRAENTDDPTKLSALTRSLVLLSRDIDVVMPVHPRTRAALQRAGLWQELQAHVNITEPVGYLEMVALERDASFIATDSGGVQKEAYFFGVPCITLRRETEWRELVQLGWNTLCPPELGPDAIAQVMREILSRGPPADATERPYGEGNSAELIVRALHHGLR